MNDLNEKIKESIKALDKSSSDILKGMNNQEYWVNKTISEKVIALADKIINSSSESKDSKDLELIIHGSSYMNSDECIMMLHILQQKCPDIFELISELTEKKKDYALFLAQRFSTLHKSAPIYKMLNPVNMSYLLDSMRLWSDYRAMQQEGRA